MAVSLAVSTQYMNVTVSQPTTSDGKIYSNRFGRQNQFEWIRTAEPIWLIIASVTDHR